TRKSRQAFIEDTTKNLSAFSALLPHTQEIILACEKRNNLNRLARLVHLNESLVKQDETSAELNNYKLNFLAEIIAFNWLMREKENMLMRLKEMLLKEDHLSAELTYSRVTSLQEIIDSFSDMPPLLDERELDKWYELNERLTWLSVMELQEARLFSIRSNREVFSKKGSRHKRKLRTQTEPPPAGPVYINWLKPPQTAISKHASLSASRTSLPDQHGAACYY
ncbi:hypothetical protein A2U01_0011822, partial [Trifolium medium]|nr:hypothetical protein [Trifolium medium]